MSNLQRITNIQGAGTFPHLFFPRLIDTLEELGASRCILTMGDLEINRSTFHEPTNYGRGGIKDVSPSPEQIKSAVGHLSSDKLALQNQENWEHLAKDLVSRVVREFVRAQLVDGQGLWCQGIKTGHGKPAELMLRDLKERLPRHFVVALSTIPDSFDKRQEVRGGHELFLKLQREGLIETTLLTDNGSPFAKTHNLDLQDRFLARALASLIGAQAQFNRNPSMAEVARSTGKHAPFVGLSFCSRELVVARSYPMWNLVRGAFGLPDKGFGNLGNIIQEARTATKKALTDTQALAIEDAIDEHKPVFVVYTIPLSPQDGTRWLEVSNALRTWLANKHDNVIPVFAAGRGMPTTRSRDYWLQVSALFPLSEVPAPLRGQADASKLKRGRPLKLAAAGNGRADRKPVALAPGRVTRKTEED